MYRANSAYWYVDAAQGTNRHSGARDIVEILTQQLMGRLILPIPETQTVSWLAKQVSVDAGTGDAKYPIWLREKMGAGQAYGLDPSIPADILNGRPYLWPIHAQEPWPVDPGTVRVITIMATPFNVSEEKEYAQIAQEFNRALAPNGLIIWWPGSLKEPLKIALERHGFQIVTVQDQGSPERIQARMGVKQISIGTRGPLRPIIEEIAQEIRLSGLEETPLLLSSDEESRLTVQGFVGLRDERILINPAKLPPIPTRAFIQGGLEEPLGLANVTAVIQMKAVTTAEAIRFFQEQGVHGNDVIFANLGIFSPEEIVASLPLVDPPPGVIGLPEGVRLTASEAIALAALSQRIGPIYIIDIARIISTKGETLLLLQAA